jgi:hypothetical protein
MIKLKKLPEYTEMMLGNYANQDMFLSSKSPRFGDILYEESSNEYWMVIVSNIIHPYIGEPIEPFLLNLRKEVKDSVPVSLPMVWIKEYEKLRLIFRIPKETEVLGYIAIMSDIANESTKIHWEFVNNLGMYVSRHTGNQDLVYYNKMKLWFTNILKEIHDFEDAGNKNDKEAFEKAFIKNANNHLNPFSHNWVMREAFELRLFLKKKKNKLDGVNAVTSRDYSRDDYEKPTLTLGMSDDYYNELYPEGMAKRNRYPSNTTD